MDAVTLYTIAVCQGCTPSRPPCSASIYRDDTPAKNYTLGKNRCLHAARRAEAVYPKYEIYCIGSDGVSLDASGRAVDKDAYYKALADWWEAQDRKKLSAQ